jgi:transcriptional regulator with XRE-family HTH domain
MTEQADATNLLSAIKHPPRNTKQVELKDIIREERNRRGWSQRALAKALGVSPGAVAQWETGDSGVSLARLVDLCAVFGLQLTSFLGQGSPYAAQIVQDSDELALLAAFRDLPEEERTSTLRMLRAAVRGLRPGDVHRAKHPRKAQ